MAEWERVFITAEDMVGVRMLNVAGNVNFRLGGLDFEILRYVEYLGGGIEANSVSNVRLEYANVQMCNEVFVGPGRSLGGSRGVVSAIERVVCL